MAVVSMASLSDRSAATAVSTLTASVNPFLTAWNTSSTMARSSWSMRSRRRDSMQDSW